jgi:hypothetical protein
MKTIPNDSKINDLNGLKHQMEYLDFITWIATPSALRFPKTQRELSRKFGVGQDTLSEWKNRPRFWTSVAEKRKQWGEKERSRIAMLDDINDYRSGNFNSVIKYEQNSCKKSN